MTSRHEYDSLRAEDAVHVWQGRTTTALPDPAGTAAVLSGAELAAMERLPRQAGLHYGGAHAGLRQILAGYLGVSPAELRFGRRPCPCCGDAQHGRPRLEWPDAALDFNLSRSGPHWLLAVTAGHQVGVDVEDGCRLDIEGTSALVMSPSELTHLRSQQSPSSRQDVFFRCWTRKEAIVKASGVGIVTDLMAIDVRPASAEPVTVTHQQPSGPDTWLVRSLTPGGGLYAALATDAARCTGPVRLRTYNEPVAYAAGEGALVS
ncbi:4'-phosphopantetheinyl transferase superfamily protein [Streptomyces sp. ISL-98]|uniref:4'-phosphopantetheinyl transferase family protein n=1 Tax=Streptomyces sp. ISL-98 TaxID=2819192 RepID=UPI001BEB3B36|nr:4'-phosphopantetheinyl transferase superfamily protein [Streptomyces sp. ISL-98]MBT2510600.1 4'-phosphopantetheinyl transferase superfamily protein [Streptomyces sp. ISL-98]